MQGYKTWTGLVLTALGAFGVFDRIGISQESVSGIIDAAVTLGGLVFAAYGNYSAHQRLRQAENAAWLANMPTRVSYTGVGVAK